MKFDTCIDVIKRNASNRIAINYEFHTVTMLSIFATFENKGCGVQMSRALIKTVCSHNLASKTHRIYFSHFPEILV